MTKLAVPIFVHSVEQTLAAAAQAAAQGAEMIELRLDGCADLRQPAALDQIDRLLAGCPLPAIVTCRPTWEGGQFDGEERQRIAILQHAGLAQPSPAYLDVELAALRSSANLRQKILLAVAHPGQLKPVSTQLIVSSHDFTQRPADLAARVEAMTNDPACAVVKIVWRATEVAEAVEALRLLHERRKPMIALAMGEAGLLSRVLAKKFGGVLTFATLDQDQATAPGQPTLAQLKQLYRWDALDPATQVYGVIGWPVAHSLSPAIHNAGFTAIDFPGVYLPLPIAPGYEALARNLQALLDFAPLHFRGASVTIPHKENLLRFVRDRKDSRDEIEPLAQRIGAANTLVVREDGSLYAGNTDYAAILDALGASLDISRAQLADLRVAVIGAGGAARAAVAALAHYGATVVIYNRTRDRAEQLAQEFNGQTGKVVAAPLEKLCASCCQVYLNCTPVGMHPQVDATPIPESDTPASWGPGTVVFDTIYNPHETRLLREARRAGCLTIPGSEMFVRQAVGQFEAWTDQPAPRAVFQNVILGHLGR